MGGRGIIKFCNKLNRLKKHCSNWNKDAFGNIFHNTKVAQQNANETKKKFFENPFPLNLTKMNKNNVGLINALNIDDTFWKTKSLN